VRRLFSNFARGLPGIGLLLLRLVCGSYLIIAGVAWCRGSQNAASMTAGLFAVADGALLFVGLWTPVAGPIVLALSAWNILAQHGSPHFAILLAAIGAALALIGPGAISMDARLFGWKKIDLAK
jgi:putative oxidoreductase